jgi:hypothetical protein
MAGCQQTVAHQIDVDQLAQSGKGKQTVIKILVIFYRWNRLAFLFSYPATVSSRY